MRELERRVQNSAHKGQRRSMVKFRQLLMAFIAITMICMLGVEAATQSTTPASTAAEPATAPTPEAKPVTEAINLAGTGLAHHPVLYGGEWDTRHREQTMFITRG